jgi:hypothetical protein
MNEPARVRRIERVRERNPVVDDLFDVERAALQAVLEGFALQPLHDEEAVPIGIADVVQGADVGMVQRGDGPRFPIEPGAGAGVAGEFSRQHLDRDRAVEPGVAGLVHFAHAAGSERFDDFVGSEPRTRSGVHIDRRDSTPGSPW